MPSSPSISAAAAASPGACWRAGTISMLAAALARRQLARLARLGSSQHAVERHAALPRRRSTPMAPSASRELIAGGAAESIFQPEWSPDGAQIVFVSDRSGWWNLYRFELATRTTRALAPMAAEFGSPQWSLGMSTYAFAGARADRLRLFAGRARPAGGAGSRERNAACRSRRRSREFGSVRADGDRVGVSRRRARPSRQHRRARSRVRPAHRAEEGDRHSRSHRPAPRRLPHAGRKRGIPDHRRQDRVRPVLSAAQSRLCRPRRRAAAAAGEVPRRADLGRLEHAQPGHSILDQPRHRGARRELRRQHRLRPRLPRPPAPHLGRGRRRRLRQRRRVPRRRRDGSTASDASSAAAAPAATPPWRR